MIEEGVKNHIRIACIRRHRCTADISAAIGNIILYTITINKRYAVMTRRRDEVAVGRLRDIVTTIIRIGQVVIIACIALWRSILQRIVIFFQAITHLYGI